MEGGFSGVVLDVGLCGEGLGCRIVCILQS